MLLGVQPASGFQLARVLVGEPAIAVSLAPGEARNAMTSVR
ncbi:MAG TPA: hypothetical protein VMA73_25140 [Streptosporangiaceae bacterium]|nr:hypothetical protein [Streptosporangiaceae bacterium]